jgi:hypothetical protein
MRICPCGGHVGQWEVKDGERWECVACGRRETVERNPQEDHKGAPMPESVRARIAELKKVAVLQNSC